MPLYRSVVYHHKLAAQRNRPGRTQAQSGPPARCPSKFQLIPDMPAASPDDPLFDMPQSGIARTVRGKYDVRVGRPACAYALVEARTISLA
ncbi:hypothetical protein SPKIRA_37300 (plasmid) [Sphingomonas paucimobilis]|nr:hypothetical protein SPKIRA_37300 [Sphingomonas paucimobilis]